MKKLIILASLILFLSTSFVFAQDWNYYNWYQYIGKQVRIVIEINFDNGYVYEGKVVDVVEMEYCLQHDSLGNCIDNKEVYTLFLNDGASVIPIQCERIRDITIIEEYKNGS